MITLEHPMMITSRLLLGIKLGDGENSSFISVESVGYNDRNREVWRYYIDTPEWEYEAADLSTGCGQAPEPREVMEMLLSFLLSAVETYKYSLRTTVSDGEEELFPRYVTLWAYDHCQEMEMIQFDLSQENDDER